MTKEQLWDAYVTRNPSFAGTEPVTLTPAGLRKLFDQTWDKAAQHTRDTNIRTAPPPANPFPGIFDQFRK